MKVFERRASERRDLQLAMCFRVQNDGDFVIPCETLNISRAGLFMRTYTHLSLGAHLILSIRIPVSMSGTRRLYFHCAGHVIHDRTSADGCHGYGIQFDEELSARQLSEEPIEAP